MHKAFQRVQINKTAPRIKIKPLTDQEKLERARKLWPELIEAAEKGILEDDQPPILNSSMEEKARKK